ncbi:MAG: HAD family phosphatase [Spirochaetales bacterium]|nr:HAD family phosphatase [Spirochaetales bacterium]
MGIKAVIFDMDGLLFDTESLYIGESKKIVESMGHHIPDAVYLDCVGASHPRTREILIENLGGDFPLEEWEKRIHHQVIEHLETRGVDKKSGVDGILSALKAQHIPMAVASSTRRKNVEGLLKLGGIRDYFDYLVCGDEVKHSKPDPEIFLKAAGALEIKPANCLVFEDSFQGIRAANAAGMRPVMIPDLKQPDSEISGLCFRVCDSLLTAENLLSELLS